MPPDTLLRSRRRRHFLLSTFGHGMIPLGIAILVGCASGPKNPVSEQTVAELRATMSTNEALSILNAIPGLGMTHTGYALRPFLGTAAGETPTAGDPSIWRPLKLPERNWTDSPSAVGSRASFSNTEVVVTIWYSPNDAPTMEETLSRRQRIHPAEAITKTIQLNRIADIRVQPGVLGSYRILLRGTEDADKNPSSKTGIVTVTLWPSRGEEDKCLAAVTLLCPKAERK